MALQSVAPGGLERALISLLQPHSEQDSSAIIALVEGSLIKKYQSVVGRNKLGQFCSAFH